MCLAKLPSLRIGAPPVYMVVPAALHFTHQLTTNMTTITKRFVDFPFAHRQPRHAGHCALIHGHNWSFEFEFSSEVLDVNGFVLDFGDLKWLRDMLTHDFDHTLVLNEDDPYLQDLRDMLAGTPADASCGERGCPMFARIRVVPNCGAEGLAAYLLGQVQLELDLMQPKLGRHVTVTRVTVFEDSKNSATVTPDE